MKTIWKYEIETIDGQAITMPVDAKILTVQLQNGRPCLWAMVDPDENFKDKNIFIFGTGHTIKDPHKLTYIGTYQIRNGALVFHVFEQSVP